MHLAWYKVVVRKRDLALADLALGRARLGPHHGDVLFEHPPEKRRGGGGVRLSAQDMSVGERGRDGLDSRAGDRRRLDSLGRSPSFRTSVFASRRAGQISSAR